MRIRDIRTVRLLAASAGMLGLSACSDDSNNPPNPPGLTVAKASPSGDAQTGQVATALANPIRVVVTRDGTPEAGVTVNWATTGTGASVAPASNATDAQGIAAATWTLRQAAGATSATATVTGATGSPITFTATANAGPATALVLAGGNNQQAEVGTAVALPLEVRATDQFTNPVAGVAVAWAVTGGGGSVAPPTSNTTSAGLASTVFTLGGSIGSNTATATAAGLTGSPVSFTATGTAPPIGNAGVVVGNNFFDPVTRTVPAGTKVTWTWTNTGATQHSVTPTGIPTFTGSAVLSGNGTTHEFTFSTPGTYTYECSVHGSAMSGTIEVQ